MEKKRKDSKRISAAHTPAAAWLGLVSEGIFFVFFVFRVFPRDGTGREFPAGQHICPDLSRPAGHRLSRLLKDFKNQWKYWAKVINYGENHTHWVHNYEGTPNLDSFTTFKKHRHLLIRMRSSLNNSNQLCVWAFYCHKIKANGLVKCWKCLLKRLFRPNM